MNRRAATVNRGKIVSMYAGLKRPERQLEVTEMIRLPREWQGMARLGMSTSEGQCELKVRTQGMYIYLSDMIIYKIKQ